MIPDSCGVVDVIIFLEGDRVVLDDYVKGTTFQKKHALTCHFCPKVVFFLEGHDITNKQSRNYILIHDEHTRLNHNYVQNDHSLQNHVYKTFA